MGDRGGVLTGRGNQGDPSMKKKQVIPDKIQLHIQKKHMKVVDSKLAIVEHEDEPSSVEEKSEVPPYFPS